MGEEVGIRGRIRPRRAADRRLVDVDHLVEDLDPLDVGVLAGLDPHLVEPVRERLVDDLVHERRLAGARDAGDADELADGEVDVDPLQVVLGSAAHGEDAAVVVLASRWHCDRAPAGEEVAGDGAFRPHHGLRVPLGDDVPAVLPGSRTHVDDPVGRPHHLLVVLDDEDGVAEPLQPLERRDEAVVVALVEADRRLVEDVEDADELRPDLRRQPEPLRLSAGERLRGTVQLQVADADVGEEREPLADLLHDPVPDQLLGRRQLELVEERQRPGDREPGELVDRAPADGDGEHGRLEAGTVALGTGSEAHVLLDPLPLLRRVGLPVAALEVLDDPLERHRVLALAAHPVPVLDEDPVPVRPVQEQVLLLLGQIPPRAVGVELVPVGDRLDHALVEARAPDRPRHEGAVGDRDRRVRDEHVRVDLELRAEPGAARAGAVRGVEREDARLQLWQRDAVLGTSEVLREEQAFAVDDVDADEPFGERRSRLDRLRQPLAEVRLEHEPVDDDLDRVLELLVEDDLVLEQALLAVDLDPREPVAPQLLEHVPKLALAIAHDRRVDGEAGPLREARGSAPRSGRGSARRSDGRRRGSAGVPRVHRGGEGSRRPRSRCRRSSAGCGRSSSGRSRSPARARRSSRRRASPSSAGTGGHTPRGTPRSAAGPLRRSCRTRATTSPSRRGR